MYFQDIGEVEQLLANASLEDAVCTCGTVKTIHFARDGRLMICVPCLDAYVLSNPSEGDTNGPRGIWLDQDVLIMTDDDCVFLWTIGACA